LDANRSGEVVHGARARRFSHLLKQGRIPGEPIQTIQHSLRIPERNEKTLDAITDKLGEGAVVIDHRGPTRQHSFTDASPEGLCESGKINDNIHLGQDLSGLRDVTGAKDVGRTATVVLKMLPDPVRLRPHQPKLKRIILLISLTGYRKEILQPFFRQVAT